MKTFAQKFFDKNPKAAAEEAPMNLAEYLINGHLKLFLGAGVSIPFGLPNWNDLINKILIQSKKIADGSITDKDNYAEHSLLIDELDRELSPKDFNSIVSGCLYKDLPTDLDDLILNNSKLFVALAALCSSQTRGRIKQIFTLNFDNILEQYLELIGVSVNSGAEVHRYERHTDIRIDHLNGYLPQGIESTAKIVFSPRSFDEHQAKKGQGDMINEWFVDSCLGNKLLFIGVSGDDQIMTINTKSIRNVYARFGVIEDSVAGYALLSESAYTKNRAKFLDGNIMPIQVDANDIPKYLLNICKLASQRVIRQK